MTSISSQFYTRATNFASALSGNVDPRMGQYTINLAIGTLNANDLLGPSIPLGGVDEFEPVSCGSNMNHADEALGELVVSSSNGAVDFQSAKHPFD